MEIMAEVRDLVQWHKPLPGKCEVISSIPGTINKKKSWQKLTPATASQAWWPMSVFLAAGEAEAGEVQLCETLTQNFKEV